VIPSSLMRRLESLEANKLREFLARKNVALGLDLGLKLGYAIAVKNNGDKWQVLEGGVGSLDIKPKKYETTCTSYFKFLRFLDEIKPGQIFYEDIKYTPPKGTVGYGRLVHSFSTLISLRTVLEVWAEENGASLLAINPSKISSLIKVKSGRAKKEEAINFVKENFGIEVDHHGADALICLMIGLE